MDLKADRDPIGDTAPHMDGLKPAPDGMVFRVLMA